LSVINGDLSSLLLQNYQCSHKICIVQMHIGKTALTVLLSEIILILFTFHFFIKTPNANTAC